MKRFKKALWAVLLLLLIGGTAVVISGLERDMQSSYKAYTGENPAEMLNGIVDNQEWEIDRGGAFFVEYRLQRDRIRSQEVEMLEDLLNNPNTSDGSKQEAEEMIIELVQLMEQELLIENMIKAQGFEDAIFFYRNQVATVMVKQQEISEREFIQITDAVAGVAGINREDIQVIARY
jgi:stage III sporulation protein AH